MKSFLLGLCLILGGAAHADQSSGLTSPATIRFHTNVAGIDLGGMTPVDAARRLREWWEGEKKKELIVHCPLSETPFPKFSASKLGVTLDDAATVAQLPIQNGGVEIDAATSKSSFNAIFKSDGMPKISLDAQVEKIVGKSRPARVYLEKGALLRVPEISTAQLNEPGLLEEVSRALNGDHIVTLPFNQGEKKVSDAALAQITDVVSSFSTHFPTYQHNRNSNIKLASSILNGVVLLPGEKLSFNGTVGMRTVKRGFKLAGVYKNGRHDTGIGGGICQVSTTLYNACLFGDLKIVRRSNHSMPVAYVPLGRDATVDYGNLDLVFENNYSTPIAVSSACVPGRLTFRILGKKVPGQTVKMIQVGEKEWDAPRSIVPDPRLPVGTRRVIEDGTDGRSITTYRLVYLNGVLQNKEFLSHSYYEGGLRVIEVGTAPPKLGVPPVQTAPPIRSGPTVSSPPTVGG